MKIRKLFSPIIITTLGFGAFSFCIYPNYHKKFEINFDFNNTTPLLQPPYVSTVINDPSDPLSTKGIILNIIDKGAPVIENEFSVLVKSDNEDVVSTNDIHFTKNDGKVSIYIKAISVGYATVTISVNGKNASDTKLLNVAASKNETFFDQTFWHTSIADASAAISVGDKYMLVADDEKNQIALFNRFNSGMPIYSFNYEKFLNLEDGDEGNYKEIDCEAAVRSPFDSNRIYWLGSMSNGGKSDKIEKNRNCLFATKKLGSNENTTLKYIGCIKTLRSEILKWGDSYNYELSKAGKNGQNPKNTKGFNIEGVCFAPDQTTLYVCCRAPLVPTNIRENALIIPIKNFENWFNDGAPISKPDFGMPIELSLQGRGIRDIVQINNNKYIIVAGMSNEINNFYLYGWTGQTTDKPFKITSSDLNSINPEGIIPLGNDSNNKLKFQLISDNGNKCYYLDNIKAKYLQKEFKKFRSDIITVNQF